MFLSFAFLFVYLINLFPPSWAFAENDHKKRIIFFPQVHYINELESMEPEEKKALSEQILECQFYIYHQLLARLKVNPNLAVYNESFYFSKLELYRMLSKKENRLRKKYRMPPLRHDEVSLVPETVETEISAQLPQNTFYKIDWNANSILRHGLVNFSIPKSYESSVQEAFPESIEELSHLQKQLLIKYGAGDLLVLQGHIKNAKATSETGKKSGYDFLRKIEQYKNLPMEKRIYSRKNILTMCPELVRSEPDFAMELEKFLDAHPHSQGGFLGLFDPFKFWLEELDKNKDKEKCTFCEGKNGGCQAYEDELLDLMHLYHVYLTRELEVVSLINDFMSLQVDGIDNDEVALIFGAAHDFAAYFAEDETYEFLSFPKDYSHYFDD